VDGIYQYYLRHAEKLPADYLAIAERDGVERAVCDYVSGMTDKYAMSCYSELYLPMAWQVK
jgi:dGTPase